MDKDTISIVARRSRCQVCRKVREGLELNQVGERDVPKKVNICMACASYIAMVVRLIVPDDEKH